MAIILALLLVFLTNVFLVQPAQQLSFQTVSSRNHTHQDGDFSGAISPGLSRSYGLPGRSYGDRAANLLELSQDRSGGLLAAPGGTRQGRGDQSSVPKPIFGKNSVP